MERLDLRTEREVPAVSSHHVRGLLQRPQETNMLSQPPTGVLLLQPNTTRFRLSAALRGLTQGLLPF